MKLTAMNPIVPSPDRASNIFPSKYFMLRIFFALLVKFFLRVLIFLLASRINSNNYLKNYHNTKKETNNKKDTVTAPRLLFGSRKGEQS